MEKKRYIIPQVSVMNMENLSIIATSDPNVINSGNGTGNSTSNFDTSTMVDGEEGDEMRSAGRIYFDDWE